MTTLELLYKAFASCFVSAAACLLAAFVTGALNNLEGTLYKVLDGLFTVFLTCAFLLLLTLTLFYIWSY